MRQISGFIANCPKPFYDTGCTFCEIPDFPDGKQIDFERNLNGTAPKSWKQVLVLLHGVTDFDAMPSKITLIAGSLAQQFDGLKRTILSSSHPVTISNVQIEKEQLSTGEGHRVRIYPDCVEVQFGSAHVADFMRHYLLPDVPQKSEIFNPFSRKLPAMDELLSVKRPEYFNEQKIAKELVLICGHTQRDERCGILAPIIKNEFEKVLEKENMSQRVDVGLISHVGGHAYAGNVIYYPSHSQGRRSIWYGRVFPEQVQGIVRATIKEGLIIKDLYRG